MNTNRRLALILVSGVAVVLLGGCNLSTPPTNDEEETGLQLLSWNDSGPIDYNDATDWTMFSFSDFKVKMPRNFRVINLTDDQQYVELVNFAEVAGSETENLEYGKLKLKVSILTHATTVEEAAGEGQILDSINVAGRKALKTLNPDGGFVVYVKSLDQNQVYSFDFSEDFVGFENLTDLIISSIAFHQRGSVS